MNDKNIFIGVCEDNSLHINLVKGYIDDFFNEFHNYEVLEFVSGEDLLSNYPNNIDLLFLDIQMNGLNGMDVARRIREFDNNVEIIFTTSVLDYVCEGYEVNAYRYMLKPIEYNIFKNNMGKCIENIIKKKNDFLTINDKSKLIKIKFDDILYIETSKRQLIIHTINGHEIIKMSMRKLEKLLNKDFFRCHNSFIVNLEKINKIEGGKIDIKAFNKGKLVLVDNFFYDGNKNYDFSNEKLTLKNNKKDKQVTANVQLISQGEKVVKFSGDNEVGIPFVYMSKSLINNFTSNKMTDWITVDCKKEYSKYIKKKLDSMQKEGYIDAKMDASENFTQSKIMMNVVGGGIAIIFIFIGLLNFINVMITNVSTRLRELAIMESVGMTKKQIKKMLTYEGLYYAGITLGMIFTLGLGIIYVIADMTQNLADYAKFIFPTNQLIFLVIVITLVCSITPGIVYKFSSKQSVIDRLREINK